MSFYGEKWYKRAARRTGRAVRKALIPAAITLGVATGTYGVFYLGRVYQAIGDEEGTELKVLEQKIERSATIKDGRLHVYEKSEQKRVIPLEEAVKQNRQEKKQMIDEYM
jgi:hypothetical protein